MILPMKKIEKLVEKDRQEHILEVYVKYPKELPKKHNEMPFLMERMEIEKVEKLAPNLKDSKTNVVEIKNLNQALKHSLKMKKLHRIIRFEQSYWMKPYIMLNTRLQRMSLRKNFLSL